MRTSLTRIGNSRGVRIPKAFLEECGLTDQVELAVERGRLVISPAGGARDGWDAAFAQAAGRDEEELIGEGVANRFDEEEWTW